MQSSALNSEKLRLSAAVQSAWLSRRGELGARPTCDSLSAAVGPAAEDQPHGRADSAGKEEAHAERAHRDGREVRAELAADVRRFADALAQGLRSAGELFPLRLDVVANLLDRPRVPTGHRSSAPPWSALPRESPARATAASPS